MKRKTWSILLVLAMTFSIALSGCSGDKKAAESTT